VVKEIESPEPKPSGNLIHHPGKLDGVLTMRLNDYVSIYLPVDHDF
jgi:hypothetical protein